MQRPKYCLVIYDATTGYTIDEMSPAYAMSFRSKASAIDSCKLYTQASEIGIVYKDGIEIFRFDSNSPCKYYDEQYKACFATKNAERLGCEGKKESCRL